LVDGSTVDSLLEISFSLACGAAREAYASGQYAAALAIARAGLDLVAHLSGELDAVRAQALTTIADALRMLGRLGEAREQAEKACSIARKLPGGSDSIVRDALHAMALTCTRIGDLIRARDLAREVLHLARARGQKETAEALATLSEVEWRLYRFATAHAVACEGLDAFARTSLEQGHPIRARLLHHLGMALCLDGKLDASLPLLEESLGERRRLLGDDHPESIEGRASLATLWLVRGDFHAAADLFREALELAEERLGPDHFIVADSAVGLAVALLQFGCLRADSEAHDLLARNRRIRRRWTWCEESPRSAGHTV
jgi:tetratricopeptide (TPR) repeat protein